MTTNKWRTCCACGPFKPKWMKIVDNIYKSSPNDTSNHSKLLQFCVRKPDKLDRIAAYLLRHLSTDLNHNNDNNVNSTMDAINSLMNACHQRLNLFIVNYLRMVQLLLESNKTDHQLLGCRSFMQFSQLSEDTPSYHREYEYLIQHFAKLAHATIADQTAQDKLRIAGIKGVSGVVRKCTMDQLQVNVLDLRCLNMIIPALLFNMTIPEPITNDGSAAPEESSSEEATLAFREIVFRASFNIQPVISTIFTYLDGHKLWDPPEFALFVIDNFLENIKNTQAAYTLMKQLVSHLGNENNQFTPLERTGIVKAINKTVISLAAQAVGPDIFQNFKSLLQILRQSIESTSTHQTPASLEKPAITPTTCPAGPGSCSHDDPEKMFQESIITTIAEFAKNLPDTQKIEIMKFILNFDSMCFDKANRSRQLVRVLLKTMLQVATQYKTGSIALIFNSDFLNLLLNGVAVDRDPGNRIFVQKILHTLIDRHDNSVRLAVIKILERSELFNSFKIDTPSRQDLIFMKKNGTAIIENLFLQIIDKTNKVDNLENIYCTLCLLTLEIGAEHVVVDLFRLIFGVQSFLQEAACAPVSAPMMPVTHQCAVHALLAAFINLLSLVADLQIVHRHVTEVISNRRSKSKYYLPEVAFNRSNTANSYPTKMNLDDSLFFSKALVRERLTIKNCDTSSFDIPFKMKIGEMVSAPITNPRKMSIFAYMAQGEMQEMRLLSNSMTSLSVSESGSTIQEEDEMKMRNIIEEDQCSFDAIKRLLEESNDDRNKRRTAKEMELTKYFREVGFEKICRDQREKYLPLRQNLLDIVHSSLTGASSLEPLVSAAGPGYKSSGLTGIEPGEGGLPGGPPDIWEIDYPDMFVS